MTAKPVTRPPPKMTDEELIASILASNPKLTRERVIQNLKDAGGL
jgi:hypothetical protein